MVHCVDVYRRTLHPTEKKHNAIYAIIHVQSNIDRKIYCFRASKRRQAVPCRSTVKHNLTVRKTIRHAHTGLIKIR